MFERIDKKNKRLNDIKKRYKRFDKKKTMGKIKQLKVRKVQMKSKKKSSRN